LCYCSGGTNDFYFFPALGANASSGGDISGRFLTPFPALNHPTRAVERALLSAYAYRVLTVACNLICVTYRTRGSGGTTFQGSSASAQSVGYSRRSVSVSPSPRLPVFPSPSCRAPPIQLGIPPVCERPRCVVRKIKLVMAGSLAWGSWERWATRGERYGRALGTTATSRGREEEGDLNLQCNPPDTHPTTHNPRFRAPRIRTKPAAPRTLCTT